MIRAMRLLVHSDKAEPYDLIRPSAFSYCDTFMSFAKKLEDNQDNFKHLFKVLKRTPNKRF